MKIVLNPAFVPSLKFLNFFNIFLRSAEHQLSHGGGKTFALLSLRLRRRPGSITGKSLILQRGFKLMGHFSPIYLP